MENNELLEVSNEAVTDTGQIKEDSVDKVSNEISDSQDSIENDTSDKKTKKKKSSITFTSTEIFVKGDRVIVDESQNPTWTDGSQIPRWIYTRRFYVVDIHEDSTCEISLNLNGNVSGIVSPQFLKKVL